MQLTRVLMGKIQKSALELKFDKIMPGNKNYMKVVTILTQTTLVLKSAP